ncbi:hypothetical protein N431DRAFT_439210 [Stipitochalara longipes BDJ]|nr:hypothetical protein N431DRAFT_439210 [Stipitochalara longipes BDJ]
MSPLALIVLGRRAEGLGGRAKRQASSVAGGWKDLPIEAMQMGMDRVGTACRTTSSDVKSSSRKTRPVHAGTGRRDVGARSQEQADWESWDCP